MTKKTEENQHHLKVEKFSRSLRVVLKPEELASRADRAAHLLCQRDEKAEEVKASSSQLRAQIKELEAELRKVSNEVRDKATYQQVPCERRYNFRLGKVVEVRTDTGDELTERAMSDAERQLSIDAVDADRLFTEAGDEPDQLPLATQKKKRARRVKTKAANEDSANP
ncbi:MAG: hypothetical protein H0U56_15545 [Methylibium sp.]|nr:hypothetical protein [Methylibium sp.]